MAPCVHVSCQVSLAWNGLCSLPFGRTCMRGPWTNDRGCLVYGTIISCNSKETVCITPWFPTSRLFLYWFILSYKKCPHESFWLKCYLLMFDKSMKSAFSIFRPGSMAVPSSRSSRSSGRYSVVYNIATTWPTCLSLFRSSTGSSR